MDIYSRSFDALGNPLNEVFIVNSNTFYNSGYPDITELPNGYAIAWNSQNRNLTMTGIYASCFDAFNATSKNDSSILNTKINKPLLFDVPQPSKANLKSSEIPTSIVENIAKHEVNASEIVVFNEKRVHDSKQNIFNQLFDEKVWDNQIKKDPHTGQPVYTYILSRNGEVVGTAEFYGKPLLCESEDGLRNNLIKTTGILTEFEITQEMPIEEVCQVLPPTLFDRVLMAAKDSATNGAVRGGANVVGYVLSSDSTSKQVAQAVSEAIYITGFFILRYSFYSSLLNDAKDTSDYISAIFHAAADTGQMLLVRAGLHLTEKLVNGLGSILDNYGWKKTSNALQKCAKSLTSFGLYASNANQLGVPVASAAVVSGTLTQIVTELVGTSIVDRVRYDY